MAKERFRNVKQGKITQTQKTKEPKLRYTSLLDYFKALITDSFMLWMIVVYFVIYVIFGGREGFAANMLKGWIYILTILTVIEVLFLHFSKNAQTPGMKAYNIKLIFEPTKSKPPLTTIILRQILAKFSFFTFTWLIVFFNKKHKTLQDFITGTALVYE